MPNLDTRPRTVLAPSGSDELAVRERWLRSRRSKVLDRGLIALWVTGAAVVGWLFVAGFAGLGH